MQQQRSHGARRTAGYRSHSKGTDVKRDFITHGLLNKIWSQVIRPTLFNNFNIRTNGNCWRVRWNISLNNHLTSMSTLRNMSSKMWRHATNVWEKPGSILMLDPPWRRRQEFPPKFRQMPMRLHCVKSWKAVTTFAARNASDMTQQFHFHCTCYLKGRDLAVDGKVTLNNQVR